MSQDINTIPGLDKAAILFQILGESLALTMFTGISEKNILKIRVRSKELTNISFDLNQSRTKTLITWEDYKNGVDFNIFGKVLDLNSGEMIGELIEFTDDTTSQYNPTVKSIQDDEFIIIWEDERGYYNEDPLRKYLIQ